MKSYRNILIVRTDRIGDVVLTTPAISALKKAYPQARLSILVAPATRDLIEGHPDLDEVLVDDRKGVHRKLGFWRLVRELRRRKFDLAIIFHTKKRTNSLCFFAGVPERVGYRNNKFGFLLTKKISDVRHKGEKHEMEFCLDVVRALGVSAEDRKLYVSVHKDAQEWAQQLFEEKLYGGNPPVIAVHPGASDPARKWPDGQFTDLIDLIQNKYNVQIVLVGGGNIQQTASAITSAVKKPILNLTGQTTMRQLVAILKRCRLLISNDSGPVHVACALNVPVVSIFTRNQPGINPERWQPLGPLSRVVTVPVDTRVSFLKAGMQKPEDIRFLPTVEVFAAVDSLLAEIKIL